jgi:hypothetical protein
VRRIDLGAGRAINNGFLFASGVNDRAQKKCDEDDHVQCESAKKIQQHLSLTKIKSTSIFFAAKCDTIGINFNN